MIIIIIIVVVAVVLVISLCVLAVLVSRLLLRGPALLPPGEPWSRTNAIKLLHIKS